MDIYVDHHDSSGRRQGANSGILEGVEELQEEESRWSTAGVTRGSRSAQGTSNVFFQLSGLEDVVFNGFIVVFNGFLG